MQLKALLNEMTGAEINKDRLQKKSEDLKNKQADVKRKIVRQSDKIRHEKELKKFAKSIDEKINEGGDVSQMLRTVGGKVIAYVHQKGVETRYFDAKRRLVAFENKSGTFNQFGTKISHDAVGLFLVGLKSKASK